MHIKVQGVPQPECPAEVQLPEGELLTELDTESLPPISSDEPSDLPWIPDTDDARWVDFDSISQGDQWGSGPSDVPVNNFNPASAFEKTSSMDNESRMETGSQAEPGRQDWEDNASGSETKRQRLGNSTYRRTSETSMASPVDGLSLDQLGRLNSGSRTEILDGQDEDDDHSSGDFQNQSFDDNEDKDVIRALGMENVRRLASMTDGELADFEDSSSVDSQLADDARSESSSDLSSEDVPHFRYCTNCTGELDPGQPVCMECGHNQHLDSQIFSQQERQQTGEPESSHTLLAYDECMLEHEEGKRMPHPERPDRIRAIIARLMSTGLAGKCKRIACREASRAELAACHTNSHIDTVAAKTALAQTSGEEIGVPRVYFSSDTYVRPSTFKCASLSAGGAVEATCAVVRRECKNAAAIIRPPGHHAESNMAMGFCFFNNAAVAARAAQKAGAEKVLIMDWDVHHGNGTQHIFEHDPSVLYMSIHRWDGGHFFPGTGGPSEVGKGAGAGRTVNIPWPTGNMGNGDYMAAFHHIVLPITYEFSPDIIIISAGFDAAAGDPLGGCRVTPEGFAHMTAMLSSIAPSVALLEGGYNLQATADGTEAMLRVLLGEQPPYLPHAGRLNPMTSPTMQAVIRKQAPYWACLRTFLDASPFDPFRSPFFASALTGTPLSPRPRIVPSDPFSPRKADSESLVPQGSIGPDSSQAQLRSKLNAIRSQGKSQRKLALMHALHLMAVKHKMKASNEVTKRLAKMPRFSRPHFKRTESGSIVTSPRKLHLGRADSQQGARLIEEDPFATQDSDSADRRDLPTLHQIPLDLGS